MGQAVTYDLTNGAEEFRRLADEGEAMMLAQLLEEVPLLPTAEPRRGVITMIDETTASATEFQVMERRYGNGQEWEVLVTTCDSWWMAFAELDEHRVKFPYVSRDDLRVVEVPIEVEVFDDSGDGEF